MAADLVLPDLLLCLEEPWPSWDVPLPSERETAKQIVWLIEPVRYQQVCLKRDRVPDEHILRMQYDLRSRRCRFVPIGSHITPFFSAAMSCALAQLHFSASWCFSPAGALQMSITSCSGLQSCGSSQLRAPAVFYFIWFFLSSAPQLFPTALGNRKNNPIQHRRTPYFISRKRNRF